MAELRADPLSPIDAATLWPQLNRLHTEVIATRNAEHLLVSSGLAATGLSRIPALPRTSVLGIRRGLRYRGVLVARELSGRAGWEIVSTRLAREEDDDALIALLEGAARECASRGGRTVYLRYQEDSPHSAALRKSGFAPHTLERLHALPADSSSGDKPKGFRDSSRQDLPALFRLYCRAVPEPVRRQEATTAQEWRSVFDSYECENGFVPADSEDLSIWIGAGEREGRLLADSSVGSDRINEGLELIESVLGRHGTLVVPEYQPQVERLALDRGYALLGTRLLCARRLALRAPLTESAKISGAETVTY